MTEMGKMTVRRCPHCDGLLAVYSEISVQIADESLRTDWRTGLTETQIKLAESAEATGLLAAFETTVRETKQHQTPKNIRRFFLDFMRTCVLRIVPQYCLDELNDTLGRTDIEIYGSQGIAMVVSDGQIRWFVPYDMMRGAAIKKMNGKATTRRMPLDEVAFSTWLRTKHGYVAGNGHFLEAMQRKSRGDFARLVQ